LSDAAACSSPAGDAQAPVAARTNQPLHHQVQLAAEEPCRAADQHRNQDVEGGRQQADEH